MREIEVEEIKRRKIEELLKSREDDMVIQKARELADALYASEEFTALREVQKKMQEDEKSRALVASFQEKQRSIQMGRMMGQQPTFEEMEELRRLRERLDRNPAITKFYECQRRISLLLQDTLELINRESGIRYWNTSGGCC